MATPYLDDFVGFTFNGTRSQDLHILRVSDGSRYSDTLTPNFQDTTAKMPGADGTLYWDSFYSERNFEVRIAFDSLSESDLRRLRQVFNAKAKGELIFDEAPYKAYNVKLQSPIQLTYICFDKNEGGRVYKGEGSIQFISYYPYARSVHKYISQYETARVPASASSPELIPAYPNLTEWSAACGMLYDKNKNGSPYYDQTGESVIHLYNAGDVETDEEIYVAITSGSSGYRCPLAKMELYQDGQKIGEMNFTNMSRLGDLDTNIRINSRTNLIEGIRTVSGKDVPTGTLYNKYIESGDFFKLPLGESTIHFYNSSGSSINASKVDYNHLYY